VVLDVALLLGGPSAERGISLNSARSVADHLVGADVALREIVYFDRRERPHSITRSLLYSNTPSDFDFKLAQEASVMDDAELMARLGGCDLALPAIHGDFGEDGRLQALLERSGVPYLGSDATACARAFDKFDAHEALRSGGITPVPSRLLTASASTAERRAHIDEVLRSHSRVVLKPARSGSSIGVHVSAESADALAISERLLGEYERVVVQPAVRGTEFTTIVVDGTSGPVALIPVEIELRNLRHADDIFDYRRKYLASNDSHYHCPPRLEMAVTQRIRQVSEDTFKTLGLRDFARIDCWVDATGEVLISDVNPISGMEQNSFLFIQAAQCGLTHRDVLRLLVGIACRRSGIDLPRRSPDDRQAGRRRVAVLFGGDTAERQVSVVSGTNVWLKLLGSNRFEPVPHLLDVDGSIWLVPYALALRHSVEEIAEACRRAPSVEHVRSELAAEVHRRLGPQQFRVGSASTLPVPLTMEEFLDTYDIVFNALHGGSGEDGTLQHEMDLRGVHYNGSGVAASRVCMDKYETGRRLAGLEDEGIHVARRMLLRTPAAVPGSAALRDLWQKVVTECGASQVVAKPSSDGCSAGVVPLVSAHELGQYLAGLLSGAARLDGSTFALLAPDQVVELPTRRPGRLMFEEYVATDDIAVVDVEEADGQQPLEAARLSWAAARDTGWIEVTVGVLGKPGRMRAFQPSVTVARQAVLSVEEKFMGGTGVNITPPPAPPTGRAEPAAVDRVRRNAARVAEILGVSGYARIDAFMHCKSGDLVVIEVNTLPALTPATVLYHQALAETPPIPPRELLERILDLGLDD
jgi:D-alanine--D-alanine ligase